MHDEGCDGTGELGVVVVVVEDVIGKHFWSFWAVIGFLGWGWKLLVGVDICAGSLVYGERWSCFIRSGDG